MADLRRALQSFLRNWDRRSVQLVSLAGLGIALAFVVAVPFQDSEDHGHTLARRVIVPPARLTGPVVLPKPSKDDELTRAVLRAARDVGPIRKGGPGKKLMALTFDDGPGPYTGQILSVLRRDNVAATFFQVGKQLDQYPAPARAEILLPRVAIGDHTYTHSNMAKLRKGQQRDEIVSTAATMNAAGEPVPRLFRPPYGAFNLDTLSLMEQRGMAMILWSIDSEDYTRPGVDQIVANVMDNAAPGAIVLMHDGGGDRSQTAIAVPKIVHRLRKAGYKLVTIPELLERSPPVKAQQDVASPPPGAGRGAG